MGQAENLALFSAFFGAVQLVLAWRLWAWRPGGEFPARALALLFLLNGLVGLDFTWRALWPGDPVELAVRETLDAPTPFLLLYLAAALPPAPSWRRATGATLAALFAALFSVHVASRWWDPQLHADVNGLFAVALPYAAYGLLALRLALRRVLAGQRDVSPWFIYAFVPRAAEFVIAFPFLRRGPAELAGAAGLNGTVNAAAQLLLAASVVAAAAVSWRALRPPAASAGAPAAFGAAVVAGVLLGAAQLGEVGRPGDLDGFLVVVSLFVLRPVAVGLGLFGGAYLWDLAFLAALPVAFGAAFGFVAVVFPALDPARGLLLAGGLGLVAAVGVLRGLQRWREGLAQRAPPAPRAPPGPWDPVSVVGQQAA